MKELEFITNGYHDESLTRDETLFHSANGYLGVRGCLEEGAKDGVRTVRGTYINGFYEEEEICYGERLYGFPDTKQVMVNLPDAQSVKIWAGGALAAAWNDTAGEMTRRLDFAAGISEREYRQNTAQGALEIRFTRLISFVQKEVFLLRVQITSIDYRGDIWLDSMLDGDVTNFSDPEDPRVASETKAKLMVVRRYQQDGCLALQAETIASKRVLGCAVEHRMDNTKAVLFGLGNLLAARFTRDIHPGETITLTKTCAYIDAQDSRDPLEAAISLARQAADRGFEEWARLQNNYLAAFWDRSRVRIGKDPRTQAYLDLCVYELLCAAGQNGRSSVAAKGLSGEGYEGHYFWDCEVYAFPFFLASAPDMARKLLDYRYQHLDAARSHARMLGHVRGALYPWRTIAGTECSSYYPSGSAQYHINADIAHAFSQYWYATQDESYLPAICEVLVETARLFLDAGHMEDDGFHIDGVTGPDEYTCIVDNNYYTNAGAAKTFLEAVALCQTLDERGGLDGLSAKIGVTKAELADFFAAGSRMYLPMDERLGICKQDDSFLRKKRWNLDEIPPENFPLLMHYHPLYINRRQVCKQADTVLAHFLYHEETPLIMQRTYTYYEGVTTHDSSLSACVFSMMAARLGNLPLAMRYFDATVGIDIDDQSGNTRDGLHIANMGGAYLSIIAGFGGMRLERDGLKLFPLLPTLWQSYSFPLSYRGSRMSVSVSAEGCSIRMLEGDAQEISIFDRRVRVTAEEAMIRRPIRGVLFDLDGVITDTARFHYAAWKRIATELGIAFDEKKNERLKGVSREQCLEIILEASGLALAPEEKHALASRKNAYYVAALDTLSRNDILPGVLETMSLLRKLKVPYALFSVSKNTEMILDKLGLASEFDAIVDGNDIAHSKPHFEGYLLAAERIAVDPRLCVMIEDAQAGLEGARALSMRTIGIGEHLPDGAADLKLRHTSQLRDAIERMICECNEIPAERL